MTNETLKAYTAGLLDGEGYVGIRRRKMDGNKPPKYELRICSSN